jgi:hypothetical protein
MEAGTSDIFPQFVGHQYSDFKVVTVTTDNFVCKMHVLYGCFVS